MFLYSCNLISSPFVVYLSIAQRGSVERSGSTKSSNFSFLRKQSLFPFCTIAMHITSAFCQRELTDESTDIIKWWLWWWLNLDDNDDKVARNKILWLSSKTLLNTGLFIFEKTINLFHCAPLCTSPLHDASGAPLIIIYFGGETITVPNIIEY